jgi:hypothetical protein
MKLFLIRKVVCGYVGQCVVCWGGYYHVMVLVFEYVGQRLHCWGSYNYVMLSTDMVDSTWFVGEVIIT